MKFLPLIFLFFTFNVQAERLITRVHSVDVSKDSRHPHIIKFESGRVGFLSSLDKASMLSLLESHRRGEWLDVELSTQGDFLGAGVVPQPRNFSEGKAGVSASALAYDPSNLGSFEEANAAFRRMNRRSDWSSQCYNRAHVWAYEEFRRTGLRSVKLFMFFTRSYIRKYRYKWWFHVTPMTYVNGAAVTMDRTFMKGPVSIKTWTDKFIYSKRDCPIIHRYSQYRNNQESEHCYLHPASMYYWQPRDLENFENTGFEKKEFIKSEVNWAYREAF